MTQIAIGIPSTEPFVGSLLEPRCALGDSWQPDTVLSMQALEGALRQRIERNEQLRQRPRMVYNLRGYGRVVAQIDGAWQISGDADEQNQHIVLECFAEVQSAACPLVQVNGVAAVRAVSDELQRHGLAAIERGERNAAGETSSAEFQVRGRFPLRLEVLAEAGSSTIRMQFLNLEGFGSSERRFDAAQIDAGTIDDLCRFLSRESARFAAEPVPSALQQALRERLQRDRQARRADEMRLQRLRDAEPRGLRRLGPTALLLSLRRLWQRVAESRAGSALPPTDPRIGSDVRKVGVSASG
jgi:hypothetical protein